MTTVFKKIIENIAELNSDEKALVAHCLISSLETKHDDSVDEAWGKLAKQRLQELESGSVKGVTWAHIKNNIKEQNV